MNVQATPTTRTGSVTWISQLWATAQIPSTEVTDGVRLYFATSGLSSGFSDLLIRDGRIYRDVLAGLSKVAPHPGGCAAANGGALLLSAPMSAKSSLMAGQGTWLLGKTGSLAVRPLPRYSASSSRCKAWLDATGSFTVGTFGLTTWDGTGFRADKNWFAGRTALASAVGPRYCFRSCNQHERSHTDRREADALKRAMGCDPSFTLYAKWLVGDCRRQGRVGRIALGGSKPEVLRRVPEGALKYGDRVAMTGAGAVVIGLDYGMRSYVVWRPKSTALSPVRRLADTEILARATPTLLVRGLPPRVPADAIAATLLGKKIAFGASGSTYGYKHVRRGQTARLAQTKRAEAVLPGGGALVVAYDAVVDLRCGAYVRSPLGWEGESISDWVPPVYPPLRKRAVYLPKQCTPLREVHAVPGVSDLLLGITKGGKLALAWLPAPLPLPSGHDPRVGPKASPALKQSPRPGSGWTILGPVDRVRAVKALPAPGGWQDIAPSSWRSGGGAVVRVGKTELLVTPHGTVALPGNATPMAMLQHEQGVFGAVGTRLVACAGKRCRVLDPGVPSDIVAVVPRRRDLVIVGYADGRNGLYTIPAAGGTPEPRHPLADKIDSVIASRPR